MRYLISRLVLLICILGLAHSAQATHIQGAFLAYECVGDDQWMVTLSIIQDCADSNVQPNETVWAIQNTGAFSSHSLNLLSNEALPLMCENVYGEAICSGGILPSRKRLVYQGMVTITTNPEQIRFRWIRNYRTPSANVDNSVNLPFYVHCITEVQAAPCNQSPIVSLPQYPSFCVGEVATIDLGVSEADGDSLHYSFTEALMPAPSNAFDVVSYVPGFSGNEFLSGASIDPVTGAIVFTPTNAGQYTLAVKVEEYTTSGILLGSQIIDLLVVVQDCGLSPPVLITPTLINFNGSATLSGPNEIDMCYGDNFCAQLKFTSEAELLYFNTNFNELIPGAYLIKLPGDTTTVTICYTADTSAVGGLISVIGYNNVCPSPGAAEATFTVNVNPGGFAAYDYYYCEGQSVSLASLGGENLTWNSLSGDGIDALSCSDCPYPIFTPTQNSVFQVIGTNSGSDCTSNTTVSVEEALAYQVNSIGSDCQSSQGTLDISVSSGSENYSIEFGDTLLTFYESVFDTTMLANGVYPITIYDNELGCSVSFEVTLFDPNAISTTVSESSCAPFLWDENGQSYDESGTYVHVLVAADGCDSLISLELDIILVFTEIEVSGSLLTAPLSDSFQWIDCDANDDPIVGATDQFYQATTNGSFAVILGQNGCVDTSACQTISTVGLGEFISLPISLFPNPMGESAILDLGELRGDFVLEIFNLNGQLMRKESLNILRLSSESGMVSIQKRGLRSGFYFLRLTGQGQHFEIPLIVN